MKILMGNVEGVIEQEIAAGANRQAVALSYAFGIQNQALGHPPDWGRITRAILSRYKPSGLDWIKKRAWTFVEMDRVVEGQGAGEKP